MNKWFFTLALFLLIYFGKAQNLVPNCSFESIPSGTLYCGSPALCTLGNTVFTCPAMINFYASAATNYFHLPVGWNKPTGSTATPDLHASCSGTGSPASFPTNHVGVPQNNSGFESALTGSAYCGIITLEYNSSSTAVSVSPWREYIDCQLASALLAGKQYYVEFFCSLGDANSFATEVSAHLSNGKLTQFGSNVVNVIPQITSGSHVLNKNGWTKVSGCYTAQGGENYITIGNFKSSALANRTFIPSVPIYSNTSNSISYNSGGNGGYISYYYIENVSVIPVDVFNAVATPSNICIGQSSTLTTNFNMSQYTFCSGATSTNSFVWSPSSFLNSTTASTVIATPPVSTTYSLALNTQLCGIINKTVQVNVVPSFTASIATTSAACGNNNGSATVSILPAGSYTYNWSNTQNSPTLTNVTGGNYTLTITNSGGCVGIYTVVIPSSSNFNLTMSATQNTNCILPSSASATVTPIGSGPFSYLWSNSSTVSVANNLPNGIHTVTVTAGSCTNTATVSITSNTNNPNISINTPAVLNCTNTSIVLTGTSTASGVTYTWLPQNVNTPTATANSSGNYTLVVTNTLTGCSSQSVVSVAQNTTAPLVNAIVTNTLNCSFSSAILTATSATSPLNYQWSSGPNSFSYTVNSPGNYTVTATNPANGCIAQVTVDVIQNTTAPNISIAAPATLTCLQPSIVLTGTSTTSGVTYSWSPNVIGSPSLPTATANSSGNYTLAVTNPINGCKSQSVITVSQNTLQPNISATVSNSLNCSLQTATLNGTSTTAGVTYSWLPQNVNTASTSVNSPGSYSLVVFNPINGCSSQTILTVIQNTVAPNVSAGPNQTITCTVSSVTLNGSSTTTWATFSWSPNVSGPANLPTTTANTAGNYILTVTDPANGCTAIATVIVSQNGSIPVINATVNGSLTCTNTTATLTASSSIANCSFNWQPLNVNTASTIATAVGNYTVTVTNTLSGCTSSAVISVVQNTSVASISIAPIGTLTCVSPSVIITATSNIANAVYQWNSITTNQPTYTATTPGNVLLSLLNPATGCISSSVIAITQNTLLPNISVTPPLTLTCNQANIILNGSSTTSGATFSWAPQNVATATTNVLSAGNYTFVVINPLNGCKTQSVVSVTQNTTIPNINAGPNQTITCAIPSVTLNGSSATTGATFSWSPNVSGPVNLPTTTANSSGNYTLTVTDLSNGCIAQSVVTVQQSASLPNVSATVSNILTCLQLSANLIGNSTTPNVTFSWSPNVFGPANLPTATANSPGSYTLVVLHPVSGCISTTVITVTQNTVLPNAIAISSNSLNCLLQTATLAASNSNTTIVFVWNGGNLSNATNPVQVNTGGIYTVTATNTLNGCFSSSAISVPQNTTQPNVTANTSNHINCLLQTASLIGSSSTPNIAFTWLPQNVNSQSVTVNIPGSYSLVVLDPINQCTNTAVVTVTATPMFTTNISILSQINCFGVNSGALSITNQGGGTAPFTITNLNNNNTVSNISAFPVNLNNLSAGNYSIQVTDANGCKQTLFSTINQPPQLILGISGNTIMCAGQSASITSNVVGGTAPYNFLWSPTGGNAPTLNATSSANTNFTLTVIDNNGCQALASIAIIVNPKPNASLVNGKLSGCAPVCASFSLTQTQNNTYTYNWSFSSTAPTPTVFTTNLFNPEFCFTQEGTYDAGISITTAAGCSTSISYSNLITVHGKPSADFYFTPEKPDILEHPDVSFFNQSTGANAYQWYNVNTLFSQEKDPNYIFTDPGKFLITLIATNTNCSDTVSKYVVVEDDFFFYIPNSFTPNDDGTNDFFYPVLTGNYSAKNYDFEIFDRWGELIYRSNNPQETQWNGYYKSQPCKDDVYVWKINVTNNKGKAIQKTGHVTLMK